MRSHPGAASVLGPLAVLVVGALVPLVSSEASQLTRYEAVLVNLLVVLGLNLMFGYAGELSIGQPVIMGLAAYAAGVASATYGLNAWETLPIAVGLACIVGLLLNSVSLRVKGWYLAVTTFFAVTVMPDLIEVLQKWTQGSNGLGNISPIPGMALGVTGNSVRQYEVILGVVAVVWLALRNLQTSHWGIILRSMRDARNALVSCGGHQTGLRFVVTIVASIPVGLAGWLFAHVNMFLVPDSFNLDQLLLFMGAVLLGGRGTVWGPVIGTVIFEGISLWIGPFSVTNEIVLGAAVLIISAAFPLGLVGTWHRYRRQSRGSGMVDSGVVGERLAAVGRLHASVVSITESDKLGDPDREPGTMLLAATGVAKHFGGVAALDGVDLEIRAGEVLGLIGPNGSGKTTLLNVVTGFVRPDGGSIRLGDQDLTGMAPHAIARAGVRRSFQTPQIVGELSVADNIAIGILGPRPQRIWSSMVRGPAYRRQVREVREAIERVCEAIGLSAFVDTRMDELPLGVRRIVEIGRAVVAMPRVVCLDEPAAGLPEDELDIIFGLLRQLAGRGFGVLLIEHNLAFVERVSDRVVVLERGRVVDARVTDPAAVLNGRARTAPRLGKPELAPSERGAESPAAVQEEPVAHASGQQLRVSNLSAWYGQAQALQTVTMDVQAGEIVGILGANGAGKSTLLRSIARVHRKVEGSVLVGDTELVHMSSANVATHGVSLAREGAAVFPNLTVQEHLAFAARLARQRGREPRPESDIWDWLPILHERRRQKAGLLSGGQRQLLALGMASVSAPTCLLLDEPSAGLADSVRDTVFHCIRLVAAQGSTLIIAEQTERWLTGLASRAYVLEVGRLTDEVELSPDEYEFALGEQH